MLKDIYDPLTEYVSTFKPRFKEVAEETFAELAKEANVDVAANRKTCRELYHTERLLAAVRSRIGWWTAGCVVAWLVVVGAVVGFIAVLTNGSAGAEVSSYDAVSMGSADLGYEVASSGLTNFDAWVPIVAPVVVVVLLVLLFTLIHPRLKQMKAERDTLAEKAAELKKTAWQQMESLNRLYDWDILTRMMTKTVPRLEFDPYFTTQRLADLERTYGWDGAFNAERSVIYSHSGLINGNPFVICRTRKMEMGENTYTGTKVIHWTTRERGSDGRYHTVHHSQVLTATVTAPYPEYYEKTRLIYGNTAAPDLIFQRRQSGLASKSGSLSFKWKRWRLRRKARKLTSEDYAMLTNEDFEVAFDTSNRNNNQQFALLFTPLAQESMLRLLKDYTVGYGDDFDFDKDRMINVIVPDHLQVLDLDMNPARYRNFDFDRARADFYAVNARYFRAIYFALAPLLCVPMYQQIRSHEDIYGIDMAQHSAFWEHEALANFYGQQRFKHPACVTNCILKTEQHVGNSPDESTIIVHAHGYRVERRVSYVNVWGGDGRLHSVPVPWDEYLPVTGQGQFEMREDNYIGDLPYDSAKDATLSFRERLAHIGEVVGKGDVYRRHIASKL